MTARPKRKPALAYLTTVAFLAVAILAPTDATAQSEDGSPNDRGRPKKVKLRGELKLNLRHSDDLAFRLKTPVPPSFLRPGEDALFLRTPDEGTSFELSDISVRADYRAAEHIRARVKVHLIALYNRNPTSIGDRLFVREAWVMFGKRHGALRRFSKSGFYAQLGLAPRFTKQLNRQLESYGLWGTAFGRLELMQLQLGGTLGSNIYWRGHVARRNPVFFRDPNALAADNGTDRRVPGNNNPDFESGFPILYDTYASDVSFDGKAEFGGGLGLRLVDAETRDGVDLLGWAFRGELADTVPLRDTVYGGDLDLLSGTGGTLPFRGDDKTEIGATLRVRLGGLRLFYQYTRQDIAELERKGQELELAYRIQLGGLLVSGDQPIFNWLNLAFRFSNIDNDFGAPPTFAAPSMVWDWRKYDFGLRLGIVRNADLTVEYARHDMITAGGTLHPDEALVTLRVGM